PAPPPPGCNRSATGPARPIPKPAPRTARLSRCPAAPGPAAAASSSSSLPRSVPPARRPHPQGPPAPHRPARRPGRTSSGPRPALLPASTSPNATAVRSSLLRTLLSGFQWSIRPEGHPAHRGDQLLQRQPVPVRLPQRPRRQLLRHRLPRPHRTLRPRRHERALATPHVDDALPLQLPVRLLDGVRVDPQLRRKPPNRRQRVLRPRHTQRDRALHLVHDLLIDRPRIPGPDSYPHVASPSWCISVLVQ